MFEKLFEKFLNNISKAEKNSQELEIEFDKLKLDYAKIGTSDLYKLLTEYFLARIEINRDLLEEKNPMVETDRPILMNILAENRVMRKFIEDIEAMKAELEQSQ